MILTEKTASYYDSKNIRADKSSQIPSLLSALHKSTTLGAIANNVNTPHIIDFF